MSRADSIIKRLDGALKRVGPPDRLAYKRVITRSGGDALIGRPGTVTKADTLLSPQPVYQRLARFLVGPDVPAETLLDAGSRRIGDQWMVMLSPTSITADDLSNPDVQIVFKDSAGKEEVFFLNDFEPIPLNGLDVVYVAYVSSVKRP